jgi:hypothetical protein
VVVRPYATESVTVAGPSLVHPAGAVGIEEILTPGDVALIVKICSPEFGT